MGGTRAPGPDQYLCTILRAHGHTFANQLTLRFYERWPELDAQYGEKGRRHCFEDQFWHLSTLDTAGHFGHPKLFVDYSQWLRNFLRMRGMADEIIGSNFLFLREAIASCSVLPAEEPQRAQLLAILDEALQGFPAELRQQA